MGATQTYKMPDFEIPRPLAEHVEPAFAAREMQRYETRRNPEGLFRSAWNYAEYALNQRVESSEEVRQLYFESAQNLIGMVLNHSNTHQDVRLGALVLSSYLPLFQKRSNEESISPDDCLDMYYSLGSAMQHLQPLELDHPPQWRMAETAVLALAARTLQPDLLLYPTSPREETSSNALLNHDSYFYTGDDKIPIQQKLIQTNKSYDEWITILTLQPLVEKGLRKVHESSPQTLSDQVNYLLSLIIAETAGEELCRDERKFLNYLSQAVVSHRYKPQQVIATEAA